MPLALRKTRTQHPPPTFFFLSLFTCCLLNCSRCCCLDPKKKEGQCVDVTSAVLHWRFRNSWSPPPFCFASPLTLPVGGWTVDCLILMFSFFSFFSCVLECRVRRAVMVTDDVNSCNAKSCHRPSAPPSLLKTKFSGLFLPSRLSSLLPLTRHDVRVNDFILGSVKNKNTSSTAHRHQQRHAITEHAGRAGTGAPGY